MSVLEDGNGRVQHGASVAPEEQDEWACQGNDIKCIVHVLYCIAYLYVCICVCMYVYVCVCMYVYVYVCM